ncbi:MAG: hypothetical protein EAZ53_09745 [Bacteroidetes bacterium]|nr:MAG: hypothetical protein EAZ53_09745 [Bacteroidota bacterium]
MNRKFGLKLLLSTSLISFFTSTNAQNTSKKLDDAGRIVLTSVLPDRVSSNLPEGCGNIMKNKLGQIATQNGLGGSTADPRFIITANVIENDKNVISSAPTMSAIDLDVTFYVADFQTKTNLGTFNFTAKGVGQTEMKAYISALRNINPKNAELQQFLAESKTKILEYYNTRCDFIIQQANALSQQRKFDLAIATLISVPEVCKDCYTQSLAAAGPIFKKFIDRECKINLMNARNAWNASPNQKGADKAAEFLGKIDPEAACYKEAEELTKTISARMLKLDQREWDFKLRQFDANIDLEKRRIEAYREVGVAYGTNQPQNVVYRDPLNWLF